MHMKFPSKTIRFRHLPSQLVMILWSLIALFPIWVMLVNSLKTRFAIYDNPFGIPETFNFSNYSAVLQSGDFMRYFANSFIVVVLSLLLVSILGSLAAYALASWRSRASNVLYFSLIVGMMLPIRIASIRLLEIMRDLGLLNKLWSLPPIYIAMGIPIAIFVLTEFIRQTPSELTEAGFIDGAGRMLIFLRIVLPLLRPALATVTIYNLIPFWNDLWFPLIFISDERSKTLLLGVTRLFGQYQTDWSKVLAVLTLSAVPVILLYLLMSKQFIKGLTAGAVKG